MAWGGASLYALYRIVARLAGSTDLPLGNCLVIEAVLIPFFMMISDGVLLAWLLTELRNAGHDGGGEDRLDVRHDDRALARCGAGVRRGITVALPGDIRLAGLGIHADLRQRDTSRRVFPVAARLGPDRHAGSLARGARLDRRRRLDPGLDPGALAGFRRVVAAEGGHLVAVTAMAAVATGVGTAAAYAIVLLLPVQNWVLPAADSYAHFATLPVGLWTLAALIELAQRSLPVASLARPMSRRAPVELAADSEHALPYPHVATPTS